VGLSAFEVLWRVWAPMFLSAVPFAIATYAVNVLFPAHHLVTFLGQVAATLPIFFLTIAVVFRTYVKSQVLPRVRSLFMIEAKP
jgi:hypothetical protein